MGEFNIDILNKLGKFTNQLKIEVSKLPKEGIDITQIIDYVEDKIFQAGYLPAFPCTISINDVAAHYTVYDEGYILKKSDLIKIDFGLSFEGYITDTALTVEIGTKKYEKLMQANLEALNKAIEIIQIGTTMSEIGKQVNIIATKHGFNTIHNLSGHQIGRNNLHYGLSVPNYENNNQKPVKDNTEFAIEPFFTQGEPKVKSGTQSNILHLKSDIAIRDSIAKPILTYIKENFPHLPFSKRWLLKKFDKKKVNYSVKLLKSKGIIYEYDTLVTTDGSYVSQFEDTVIFHEGKKIIVTRL